MLSGALYEIMSSYVYTWCHVQRFVKCVLIRSTMGKVPPSPKPNRCYKGGGGMTKSSMCKNELRVCSCVIRCFSDPFPTVFVDVGGSNIRRICITHGAALLAQIYEALTKFITRG